MKIKILILFIISLILVGCSQSFENTKLTGFDKSVDDFFKSYTEANIGTEVKNSQDIMPKYKVNFYSRIDKTIINNLGIDDFYYSFSFVYNKEKKTFDIDRVEEVILLNKEKSAIIKYGCLESNEIIRVLPKSEIEDLIFHIFNNKPYPLNKYYKNLNKLYEDNESCFNKEREDLN